MNYDGKSYIELSALKEKLQAKAYKANSELNDLEEYLSESMKTPHFKSMVGKCYKLRNSYGRDSDVPPWIEYFKLLSYDDYNFISLNCLERKNKTTIYIEPKHSMHFEDGAMNMYEEISEDEFNKKYDEISFKLRRV